MKDVRIHTHHGPCIRNCGLLRDHVMRRLNRLIIRLPGWGGSGKADWVVIFDLVGATCMAYWEPIRKNGLARLTLKSLLCLHTLLFVFGLIRASKVGIMVAKHSGDVVLMTLFVTLSVHSWILSAFGINRG